MQLEIQANTSENAFRGPRICNSLSRMDGSLEWERGATAVEYGLFVAFVAAVIIFGVATLGDTTSGLFQPVVTFFQERGAVADPP